MTTTNSLAQIATEIETLSSDLHKVTATIELLGKPAQLKANQIDKALQNAKDRFATALADQAEMERAQRLSGFSDIRVETRPGDNLLDTGFVIHYTKNAWDIGLNQTVAQPHTCNGFVALTDAAHEYMVTVKPEAIPAEIMALAPGNPQEAFAIYFAGKARGFFKG